MEPDYLKPVKDMLTYQEAFECLEHYSKDITMKLLTYGIVHLRVNFGFSAAIYDRVCRKLLS